MEAEGKTHKSITPVAQSTEDRIISEAIRQSMIQGARTYDTGVKLGISVGLLFCVAGFVLLVLGVSGKIEWVFEAANLKSRLTNASPGALLALMGMIIVWRYKPKVSDSLHVKTQGHTGVPASKTSKSEHHYSGIKAFPAGDVSKSEHKYHGTKSSPAGMRGN